MVFGPYNNTQALYYAASGQIRRVAYTATVALDKQWYMPLISR